MAVCLQIEQHKNGQLILTLFGIKRHIGGVNIGSLVQSRLDISWLSTTWTSYLTGAMIINEIHIDNSTLPTFLADLFLANAHVAHSYF